MKRWMRLATAAIAALVMLAPVVAEAASTTLRLPGGQTMVAEAGVFQGTFLRKRHRTTQAANPFVRQIVQVQVEQPAGTIIVDTQSHFLYFLLGDGEAIRYGIGVARDGFEWAGTHRISNKREWPGWTPPAEMRKRVPGLPTYMPGGINNPLGARALYIGSTLYRIHGTNEPGSIGRDVSSGCIRLVNDDVIDLYNRVKVGAKVIVM
jgi:lipoprotein-anchoring transpeptidase ErfK/SrfK